MAVRLGGVSFLFLHTLPADYARHHVPEYFFIFDEFKPDEIIAFRDFAAAYPIAYEFMAAPRTSTPSRNRCLGG